MDPASTHGRWADLHRENFTPADSDFTVIGVPYDGAACARKGAALGRIHVPELSADGYQLHPALLDASFQEELAGMYAAAGRGQQLPVLCLR